jgi:hypothetical protein
MIALFYSLLATVPLEESRGGLRLLPVPLSLSRFPSRRKTAEAIMAEPHIGVFTRWCFWHRAFSSLGLFLRHSVPVAHLSSISHPFLCGAAFHVCSHDRIS